MLAWHTIGAENDLVFGPNMEVRFMRRFLLLLIAILASGCTEALVAPKIDSSPPAVFEELWNEFNLRYATFPERHVNWDSLHTLFAPKITSNMPDSTLLQYCDSLLAPLRDGHVSISSGILVMDSFIPTAPTNSISIR